MTTVSTTLLSNLVTDQALAPSSYAHAVNNQGIVVGESDTNDGGDTQAAVWQNGSVSALAEYNGQAYSVALGINDNGAIVGWSTAGGSTPTIYALEWVNGTPIALTGPSPIGTEATAINDQGVVVGTQTDSNENSYAFMWQNGTLTRLPILSLSAQPLYYDSTAVAINDAGQIVGTVNSNIGVLWQNGTATSLGYFQPMAINAQGAIVGSSGGQAAEWINGTVNTLSPLTGSQQSEADSINSSGVAVGECLSANGIYTAVIWQNGAVVNLNSLLPSTSPWYLGFAHQITDSGIIIGSGYYNGTGMQYELTLSDGAIGTTIQSALQAYQAGQLSSPVIILDSAADLQGALDQLKPLAAAGLLSSIALSDSGTPTLSITGSQLSADSAVLAAVTSPVKLTVTGTAAASALTSTVISELTGSVSISDSAANVQSALNILAQAANAGKLGTVSLTDTSTPTLTVTNGQFDADGGVLPHISENYGLVVTGPVDVSALVPSILTHVTGGLAVIDNTNTIANDLDQLQSLVQRGTVTSISIANFDPQFPMPVSVSQLTSDADAIAVLTGTYGISVSGSLTVSQALADSQNSHLTSFSIADSAANIQSHLDQLQSLAEAGRLAITTITGTTPVILSVSGSQLGADSALFQTMASVPPDPQLAVVGTTTAAELASFIHSATLTLAAPLIITDSAANVQGLIDTLEVAVEDGDVSAITLTDTGTPILSLTAAQRSTDADVLKLITTPYAITSNTALTAYQATIYTQTAPITVSDDVSNIETYFDQLEKLAVGGVLTSVSITDSATRSLGITTAQFLNDTALIDKFAAAYPLQIELDSTPLSVAQLFGAMTAGDQFSGSVFLLKDTEANIAASLDQLENLYLTNDKVVAIDLTDAGAPTLTITPQQLVADASVLSALQSQSVVFAVSAPLTLSEINQAPSGVMEKVSSFQVSDSAANIFANLDLLQKYAASGTFIGATITDSGFPTVTLSASQVQSDAAALAKISGPYSLVVEADASGSAVSGISGHGLTVAFAGNAADYTLSAASGEITVTGSAGATQITHVTALQFADTTDIVAQAPSTGTVTTGNITELYGAVFGRLPDVPGLAFYQSYLSANPNTPLTTFAQYFLASPEYASNSAHDYAESTAGDTQFITDCYENLLHRAPESGAIPYYLNVIDSFTNGLAAGTAAYATAQTLGHAYVLTYFSQSAEFLSDVQVTAANPSSAQHWLVLI